MNLNNSVKKPQFTHNRRFNKNAKPNTVVRGDNNNEKITGVAGIHAIVTMTACCKVQMYIDPFPLT